MRQSFGVSLHQEDVVVAIKYWTMGLIICGLLFGLDRLGITNFLRGVIEQKLWIVDEKVFEISRTISRPLAVFPELMDRYQRIVRLEDKLAQAAVDQQKLKQLQGQLELMPQLVARQGDGYKASTVAELYVKDGVAVVGAGEINGVLSGMAVTDKNGVLVGRIGSVGRYMSRVERVGSVEFKIPAQTVSLGAKGVITADGGMVVFDGVLQTEKLEVGEVVVTGGIDGNLPGGLVIGQVTSVISEVAQVTKKATIELLSEEEGWVAIW